MSTVNYREIWQAKNFERYGEPQNLDELAHHVIQVISASNPVVGFSWDIRYSTRVSNSHAAPIQGHQNFMASDDLPRGYPGWAGRVWIRYAYDGLSDWPGPGSDPFYRTNTHTGSGGFGDYNGPWGELVEIHYKNRDALDVVERPSVFSWDYRIYEQDWPAVSAWREKQEAWCTLADMPPSYQNHWFQWDDLDTQAQDQEYLNRIHQLKIAESST